MARNLTDLHSMDLEELNICERACRVVCERYEKYGNEYSLSNNFLGNNITQSEYIALNKSYKEYSNLYSMIITEIEKRLKDLKERAND